MKRTLLYLILIATLLYTAWILCIDLYYYHFVVLTLDGLKVFIPNLTTYLLVGEDFYNLQLSINYKYLTTQPLQILCLPVVLLLAWQIVQFIRLPFKKAFISLLINYLIFHIILLADILAAPFLGVSEFARYFYSVATANLSLVVVLMIFLGLRRENYS